VLRAASRLARTVVALAVTLGLLPVALVAAAGVVVAWRQGWRPARLYRAAAWCLPMVAVWLAATALTRHSLWPAAEAPRLAWLAIWRHGDYLSAAALTAPAATPLGLLAAGWAWSRRLASMAAGGGGRSPAAAANFDTRQWRHQVRAARARIAPPGAIPLLTTRGDFVAGAVIRAVGHPQATLTRLPADRLRSHQIVIGGTGTGKSTLLLRLWAGFMAAGLARHAAGLAGPPLLIVLDCKGGADARRLADRARRVLREAGARNVAVWPDAASVSLWDLPPGQLITTLVDLIEHGTGGAAYYTDVMEAVVSLAVEAPAGPPASTASFLARLDPGWLETAYAGSAEQLLIVRAAASQLPDIALRFRAVFRRLGSGLDGPGALGDADAWYCILEGTAEVSVAEAQARALVDLLASYVTTPPQPARQCSWRSMSSARSPGGCRSGSCLSGPVRWVFLSRSRHSRGTAWPRGKTTATGWLRPPRAASGCSARPIRSRWSPSPASARRSTPPGGSPAGCGGARPGPRSCAWSRSPTPSSSAAWTPGRRPTSIGAASRSRRSSAWSPGPPHC
jgi:hypothetical protein